MDSRVTISILNLETNTGSLESRRVDRHWAGSGVVFIEGQAVAENLRLVDKPTMDASRFQVIDDLPETARSRFHALENQELASDV